MANFLKFWVPLFGRPYFFSLNEQGQAARAPSRARVGLLTQGVWPIGNEGARRNSQKRPKITLTALSEPFPAPVLKLASVLTLWRVGPGLPYILFFMGRTHILTFGAQKVAPNLENRQKLH